MSGSGKALDSTHDSDARSKSQNSGSFGDYDASQCMRESLYLSYPPSGYSDRQAQAGPMTYQRHADQMAYPASSFYEPRANYEVTQASLIEIDSRELLKVASYKPDRGPQGSQVYVYLQTTYDLANNPLNISLMFATRFCTPTLDRLEARGTHYNYLLGAQAPLHASTGWASPNVPLRLQIQNASGYDSASIEIGSFLYTDAQVFDQASPKDPSRKRKVSVGSPDISRIPSKRLSNQQLANSPVKYATTTYTAGPNRVYPYSYQIRPGTSVYVPSNIRSYAGVQEVSGSLQSTQNAQSGIEKSLYQNSTPASRSSALPSPFTSMTRSQSSGSPASSGAPSSRFQALDSPNAGNPKLIRTSTLQPSHGSSSSAASALYPYGFKAILHINGDLNTMAEGWTTEECAAKRRLIKFWRSQSNNNIDADFEAVPADSGPPQGICISCIWWAEQKECYVTSVDTIYLLESLVAIRFTVEEKNRIRRNLEGFRPITVSKTRSDSEDFFSVIMGFPNPKPRNIEKDVKVFPWKNLHLALKKIIGKYSASYSSTASAMLNPRTLAYGMHTDQPLRPTPSTRSYSGSSSSTYTTTNMMSTSSISPHVSYTQPPITPYSGSPSYGQVSTPADTTYAYTVPAFPAGYVVQVPTYTSSAQMPSTTMAPRPSWDLAAYIDTSPQLQASMIPTTQADSKHGVR